MLFSLYHPVPLTWKNSWTSAGQYLYADNCEFQGSDISNGIINQVESQEICRDHCLLNTKCTHITWKIERKACLMKQALNPENPPSLPAKHAFRSVCGYFSKNRALTSFANQKSIVERFPGII